MVSEGLTLRPLSCQTILDDGVYFFLGEHLPGGAVSLRLSACLLGGVRSVVVGHNDFLSRLMPAAVTVVPLPMQGK